ncbi:hypothetical protein [Hymenobacter mucosus]|uniref:Uncharacterized protein n=1 Tax=Hymenobacter mucosus TaxID=1411120 RepID=A0A238XZ26_9BACT|nr:hypothetical protein [Hymenobacter mucosus]SNR63972.1 hypothetical protein SAMN06269173_104497 [Hymenobacter mucosus]
MHSMHLKLTPLHQPTIVITMVVNVVLAACNADAIRLAHKSIVRMGTLWRYPPILAGEKIWYAQPRLPVLVRQRG